MMEINKTKTDKKCQAIESKNFNNNETTINM